MHAREFEEMAEESVFEHGTEIIETPVRFFIGAEILLGQITTDVRRFHRSNLETMHVTGSRPLAVFLLDTHRGHYWGL